MTIREQLDLLGRCLNKAMQEVKGRAYPAGDVPHILDELRTKPGAPSCGVMFWSEEPVGDYTETGKVLREFHLVISRGKGMKLVSGESITQGAGGGPPLAMLTEPLSVRPLPMRSRPLAAVLASMSPLTVTPSRKLLLLLRAASVPVPVMLDHVALSVLSCHW